MQNIMLLPTHPGAGDGDAPGSQGMHFRENGRAPCKKKALAAHCGQMPGADRNPLVKRPGALEVQNVPAAAVAAPLS